MSPRPAPAELPTLDISHFDAGGEGRQAFAQHLRRAAREVGFFYLTGHGVDPGLVLVTLALARRFFALPEKDKLAIEMVNSPHFRGYNQAGREHTRGQPDWREQVDFGPELQPLPNEHNLVHLADTQSGDYEGETCCVLGANGNFLKANKDALRRLAEGNIEVHEYTAAHPDEVAKWYADNLKPAGLTVADLTEILGKLVYHNHPVGQPLIDQIRFAAEDLKLVKVLDAETDPKALAERVTVNILA